MRLQAFHCWIGSTLLTLLGVAGCERFQAARGAPPAAPPAMKPPEVFVSQPTTQEITDYEDFTGRTVAIRTIDIRARVTGYLNRIQFKEGGEVERGALLFEIDPRPYQAELNRAQASVLQAQAHLKRLEADFQRASNLVSNKSISREQFDLVSGDRAEASAAVGTAEATLEMAKLNLTFTKVTAPISGRLSRTQLDAGNLVRADETILTTIVAVDPIYAYFDVDERTLLKIRRYVQEGRIKSDDERKVPVQMGLADDVGFPLSGTVNFIDNRLDAATGTLQVRGVFRNTDHMLSPGLFVRVRLPIGEAYQALLISEQALGTDQGQKFLYVIGKDNSADAHHVEIGKLQDVENADGTHEKKRVILKGLSADDRVIVSGLQRVRPGKPVDPKPVAATAGVKSPAGEKTEKRLAEK